MLAGAGREGSVFRLKTWMAMKQVDGSATRTTTAEVCRSARAQAVQTRYPFLRQDYCFPNLNRLSTFPEQQQGGCLDKVSYLQLHY